MDTSGAYLFLSLLISLASAFLITRLVYPWPWKKKSVQKGFPTEKLLFLLRLAALAFVFLVLFNPVIQHKRPITQKPVLAFLHDNSASIAYLSDSSAQKSADSLLTLQQKKLSEQYDVRNLVFDEKLRRQEKPDYTGSVTDIGNALKQVDEFIDQPVAAIAMVSDGNYNRGENPVFTARNLPYPAYTIRIGDTTARSPFFIHSFYHNPVGYLNERVPVEVDLRHPGPANDTTLRISIRQNDETLGTKKITIQKKLKRNKFTVYFKPAKIGLQQFSLLIEGLPGSQRTFFMRVNKQKQKVLILYHAVHPDIGVIQNALQESNRFEPELFSAATFNGSVTDYNMVILHQLPSGNFAEDRWFANIVEKQIPYWMILGTQSDYNALNEGQNALSILQRNGEFEEASGIFNKEFTWFKTDPVIRRHVAGWPPLTVAFGQYKQNKGSVLFYQSLHNVDTKRPAWLFADQPYRMSILAGTGLWKWGLYVYRETGNHVALHDLIYKTVKFLSLNEPKKRLKIKYRQLYNTSQPVSLEAVWYNENYEPDNTLPGKLVLKDSTGKAYKFAFKPAGNRYKIKPGIMPSGRYHFKARVSGKNKVFRDSGSFVVNQSDIEKNSMLANTAILKQMAGKRRYFNIEQINDLTDSLLNNPPRKSVRKIEKKVEDWVDQNIFLFIIVLLLVIEWIIRKYTGKI